MEKPSDQLEKQKPEVAYSVTKSSYYEQQVTEFVKLVELILKEYLFRMIYISKPIELRTRSIDRLPGRTGMLDYVWYLHLNSKISVLSS